MSLIVFCRMYFGVCSGSLVCKVIVWVIVYRGKF